MPESSGGDVARISLVIPTAEQRSEIVVGAGLLTRLPELLRTYAPSHRYVIISDANVARLHGEAVTASLAAAGLRVDLLPFPGGERYKTVATWASLLERLTELEAGRDSCVVSVGGGVTGDVAGFVAASYGRGLDFVQIPTSLLAMVDAAIGGKTGLDLDGGKNLVGAFHQPRLVAVDPTVLHTLPPVQLRDGLAEVVKHGAIADAAHFDWLDQRAAEVVGLEEEALERLILDSIRIKTRFVAEDSREAGIRAVLNFGHTIGHALERLAGYRMPHGAAVAVGMVVEARAGELAGVTEPGTAARLRALLERLELPTTTPARTGLPALLDATRGDKKARRGEARYVLLKRVGEVARAQDRGWTHAVPEEALRGALDAF